MGMIYDSIQTVLWFTILVWWIIRSKRWDGIEQIVALTLTNVIMLLAVVEDVVDDNAAWAAGAAGFLGMFFWWLVTDIIDYVKGKAVAAQWAHHDRQMQAWMRGEDWHDVK